jgi:DUF971 family protein
LSHEGIRIVSEEQARKEMAGEVTLAVESTTPTKVRVDKSGGTGVQIDWKDGHRSAWTFAWLRWGCPCAMCNEERNATGRAVGVPKPKPGGPLVMYEAPPRPVEVIPVGKYAVKFKWNDGHESGIYSWEYLRRVCQCKACVARRDNRLD